MSVEIERTKHGKVLVDPDDKGNDVCPQCILFASQGWYPYRLRLDPYLLPLLDYWQSLPFEIR